ncbi:acyltransferase domain-containing protein [Streptomyces sp. DG2A-72]|uniref:acyltransferase domain-containing protein n=1 Tax=Streptomyces sp. DG2A-72 TaxID=3051386 RepID=UPI00265C2C74|nr:acyltransferase domain-containing protein [Streptomyces sp. DG2A-72]MDO0932339.1 acyltransferase domain-containing protein [Streptomyces sp. DG2A-72]
MLPDTDALPEILLDLAVPHEDINELIRLRRTLTADVGAMRLLEECVQELVRDIGEVRDTGQERKGPRFDERVAQAPTALGGYFAVYVFVAALPHTRAYHRERGIPADVSRRTLADLGRNMAVHRRRYGQGGVHAVDWLSRHFRGELYQLGRLQFERARLGKRMGTALTAAGPAVTPGVPCLSLHICDFHGPLSPAACDRSLVLAREFFARHYPEERRQVAVCHSWLLDPQLKQYLPADSNVIRFQERFRIAREDPERADTEPVQFVFGNPDLPVDSLPRRTSVERAVGDHLRAGGHWYIGHGWFPL